MNLKQYYKDLNEYYNNKDNRKTFLFIFFPLLFLISALSQHIFEQKTYQFTFCIAIIWVLVFIFPLYHEHILNRYIKAYTKSEKKYF